MYPHVCLSSCQAENTLLGVAPFPSDRQDPDFILTLGSLAPPHPPKENKNKQSTNPEPVPPVAQVFAAAAEDMGKTTVDSAVVEAVWERIMPGRRGQAHGFLQGYKFDAIGFTPYV